MATEEYSIGYKEGYQEGWNAAIENAPPKREWQSLTDEQIRLMAHNDDEGDWSDLRLRSCWHEGYLEGARSAEAKLREKNT